MQKLPVIEVIHEALGVVWERRARLAQALLGYVLFFAVTNTLATYLDKTSTWSGFVLVIPSVAVFTLFAITCHRIVLLDAHAVPRYGLMKWSPRETRFLGWMLAVYCVAGILLFTFSSLSMLASKSPAIMLLAMLPAAYVFSRLSVLLPATALDERHDMQWAWTLTEGNGMRMMLLVAFVPALTALLQAVIASSHPLLELLNTFLTYAVTTVEIALLSVSFRRLDEMRTAIPAEAS